MGSSSGSTHHVEGAGEIGARAAAQSSKEHAPIEGYGAIRILQVSQLQCVRIYT